MITFIFDYLCCYLYFSLLELPKELIPFTVQAVKCHLSGVHCPTAAAVAADVNDDVCHMVTKVMMNILTSQPVIAVIKVILYCIFQVTISAVKIIILLS